MLSPDVFRDNRVLATNGWFKVLREFQSISLPNDPGTTYLHTVQVRGHDMMFLRAIVTDAGVVVFDLTELAGSLKEIVSTHPHDVPGLILYTLRARFPTHTELQAAIVKVSEAPAFPLDAEAAHAPEEVTA